MENSDDGEEEDTEEDWASASEGSYVDVVEIDVSVDIVNLNADIASAEVVEEEAPTVIEADEETEETEENDATSTVEDVTDGQREEEVGEENSDDLQLEDVSFLDLSGDDEEELDENDVNIWADSPYDDDDDDDDEGIEIVHVTDDEDDESSESDGDGEEKRKTTFDISLPNSHRYMGEDMEELHGRTIHSEGETVIMPLYFQPGVVLAPGQTLPLNLFHPHPIAMMKKVIAADKTFGMIMSKSRHSSDERNLFANIGVTCEIFSVKEESLYGIPQMKLKCEGRQRFRILNKQFQMDGVILGKILILPDAPLPPYPKLSLMHCQFTHRNSLTGQVAANNFFAKNNKWNFGESRYLAGFNPAHHNVICGSVAALPGWVYKLHNPYFLMDKLMSEISSWNSKLNLDAIPIDPTDFSHWITASLPLTNEMKIELLEIDSAILRLRRQIELMNKCTTTLACIECGSKIADKADLFSLSQKGPTSAYVNPGGHVHETVTFHKAKNLSLTGRPSIEYSWFPGYAWTVATCRTCHKHMGWKFTADEKDLQPSKFWGLTRAALEPVFKDVVGDSGDDEERPPAVSEVMYESNI